MKRFKKRMCVCSSAVLIPIMITWAYAHWDEEAKPDKAKATATIVDHTNINYTLEDKQILQAKIETREHEYIKKKLLAEREMKKKKQAEKKAEKKTYKLKIVSEITAYTNYVESTGKNPGDKLFGVTASGVKTQQGKTVAMSKNFPFGTKLKIEGFGNQIFEVQDRGGAIKGNRIDLYMKNVSDAKQFGRQTRTVYIIEWGK